MQDGGVRLKNADFAASEDLFSFKLFVVAESVLLIFLFLLTN